MCNPFPPRTAQFTGDFSNIGKVQQVHSIHYLLWCPFKKNCANTIDAAILTSLMGKAQLIKTPAGFSYQHGGVPHFTCKERVKYNTNNINCSLSMWRVARGSKRMFLELIHGLFIT
jgi:hypothetical protein